MGFSSPPGARPVHRPRLRDPRLGLPPAAALSARPARASTRGAERLREGGPCQHTDAFFLLEALHGPDARLALHADVLEAAPKDAWTRSSPHVRSATHAAAMGWVAMRASRPAAEEALGRLRSARARVGHDVSTPLTRAVDAVLGDALPDLAVDPEMRLRVPHLSAELAAARARHPWVLHVQDPQDLHVTGVAPSVRVLPRLAAEPRWLGTHLVALWAPFSHPFADAVRAAVDARPTKLAKTALDAALIALFDAVVRDVGAVRGSAPQEATVVAVAAVELATLRPRSGAPTPDHHAVSILLADRWSRGTIAPAVSLGARHEETPRWEAAIDRALR